MVNQAGGRNELPSYRVRAYNTSADSENKIHDDWVAAKYGFRRGLVPGVAIFGYMTVPLVGGFRLDWLERGSIQVKFHQPFYEGDEVVVRAEVNAEGPPIRITVRAEGQDGTVCATGLATVNDQSAWLGDAHPDDYPERELPLPDARPTASRASMARGLVLGTVKEKLDLELAQPRLLRKIDERLQIYYGPNAVAHPQILLSIANHALMRNFKLGPWIHTASDLINWSAARNGEEVSARGRIVETYERKGHEFVVLDLLLVADEQRVVQQVRHTAIYRPRPR